MNSLPFLFRACCLLSIAILVVLGSPVGAATPIDFNRDIRPILSDKCFKCHGPDSGSRAADLRLDLRQEAEYVLSPDDPAESELLRRVLTSDPDEKMPPSDSKLALEKHEIARLQQWIADGAPYVDHWSFGKISKPGLPEFGESDWSRNEVDAFVLKKLKSVGLRARGAVTGPR